MDEPGADEAGENSPQGQRIDIVRPNSVAQGAPGAENYDSYNSQDYHDAVPGYGDRPNMKCNGIHVDEDHGG